jgi:2-polyprenyl-6-methoxyphenol hydroxylase-like FAD-dependent oxidoreductase
MEHADVVVVGGGPTGMTLAGDLARVGRRVVVLERWPQRHPASRAFAVMARTLEVLDSRGLADELLAMGARTAGVNLWPGAAVRLDRLRSPYPYGLITPQTNMDELLETYARRQGANVVRGTEVIGLAQDAHGVAVTARPKSGGTPTTWRASYVVGADGTHSTVRDLLGIDFPGKSVLSSVVLADVHPKNPPDGDRLTLGSTANAFGFLAPYGNGWFRSMTWNRDRQLPDTAPVDDTEIRSVLNHAMGRDLEVTEISWRSRFHCDERQVTSYRHGRVFLAGDAAHMHSPMGGQGMNTGIQDAANLAWKLDLALGGADDAVLDTYHSERHPIGRRVLVQSGAMMRAVTLKPWIARRLRNMVGTRLLNFRPFADFVAGTFSGVTLRYRHARGQHRLVGTNAAHVPLREGRLTELQRTPGFLLVRECGAPVAPTSLAQAERTDSGPGLLVRPDGYVAWAGATTEPDWRPALARWAASPVAA